MQRLYEAMRAMPGVVRGTKRLPASIFTFRRMRGGGGWSKKLKKKGAMMPLGLTESQFGCSILHYQGKTKQLREKML